MSEDYPFIRSVDFEWPKRLLVCPHCKSERLIEMWWPDYPPVDEPDWRCENCDNDFDEPDEIPMRPVNGAYHLLTRGS